MKNVQFISVLACFAGVADPAALFDDLSDFRLVTIALLTA
jgi:hypothetical protein